VSNTVTVWHSRNGSPWQRIEVKSRSMVANLVATLAPARTYNDGYGNSYARVVEDDE
jgi:hypothetical protein